MDDSYTIRHEIQLHIITVLARRRYARFRDMRPPGVETNLYSYHLKLLQKSGHVIKTNSGYTLGAFGQSFVDQSESTSPRVAVMCVVQEGYGGVLMHRKTEQPHIDHWTVPYGLVRSTDPSIVAAADREIYRNIGSADIKLTHAGDCYIRTVYDGQILMSTLVHVFYGQANNISAVNQCKWVAPHKLTNYELAPAIEQIITRTFFRDPYFFEEYTVDLIQ